MGALTQNRATRQVLKAIGIFGSVKMLTILCSLVRNKLIAVVIGPVGVGLVGLYNSISDLVSTTTRLNIDQSAVREIAAHGREREAEIAGVVSRWSLVLGFCGMVFMCAASPLLSLVSFGDTSRWWAFCLLGLMPLMYSLSVGWQAVMQALHRFAPLARATAWTAVAGLAVAVPLIFLLGEGSIIWIILTYGVGMFLTTAIFRVRLPRITLPWREVFRRGRGFIALGAWITAGLAASQACSYLFVLYLNKNATTSGLGVYQAGYTILNTYVAVLFNGFWIEYFPRLTATVHSVRRTSLLVSHRLVTLSWIILPFSLVFIAADRLVVSLLYSDAFLAMTPYLSLGIAGMVLRLASWCMAHTMMARADGRCYLLVEAGSGIVSLALNILGYRCAGFVGLGAAFILWYALYTLAVWLVYRYRYRYRLTRRAVLTTIGTFAAALAAGVFSCCCSR